MNTKQVTWRKSNAWKTVGTVKGQSWKVTITNRDGQGEELNVLNRTFFFGSIEDAKAWCETAAFADVCTTLAAQWNKIPAVSTAASCAAASMGLGRGCVEAPATFLF